MLIANKEGGGLGDVVGYAGECGEGGGAAQSGDGLGK